MFGACKTVPEVVYVDRPIEVPVAVVQKLPDGLTSDCPPDYALPELVTVGAALERLAAVEESLVCARLKLSELRALE